MPKLSTSRLILTCLIVFIGVAGGVYVGAELFNRRQTPAHAPTRLVGVVDNPYGRLTFQVGDSFPQGHFYDSLGIRLSLTAFLKGRKTLMLFLQPGCKPCTKLLDSWVEDAEPAIMDDVNVTICLSDERTAEHSWELPIEYSLILLDGEFVREGCGISVWPTVVCIDTAATVVFVHEGFSDYLFAELPQSYIVTDPKRREVMK
ncbi:MAG: hypothetical protein JSU74_06770 [Candidatus Zixiibacteriota bacterium]|nr:MAG: hypothetical protein JSU74_06770 [candidate division Zixibacteria bacterium]